MLDSLGKKSFKSYISIFVVSASPLLTGQILERIATEFNQLQFHAVQSKGMPLLDKIRPVSAVLIFTLVTQDLLNNFGLT